MAPSRSRALLLPLRRTARSATRCSYYAFPAVAAGGRTPAAAAATALSARSASNYSTVADGAVNRAVALVDAAGASGGRARSFGGGGDPLLLETPSSWATAATADEIGSGDGTRYAEGPCTRMNLFTAVNAGLRTAMETDSTAVSRMSQSSNLLLVFIQHSSQIIWESAYRAGVSFFFNVAGFTRSTRLLQGV